MNREPTITKEFKRGMRTWALKAALFGMLCGAACKTSPAPPPPAEVNTPPQLPQAPPPQPADDIPANAPLSIRAHLVKLRELRNQGKMSPGEYESRKAILLEGR